VHTIILSLMLLIDFVQFSDGTTWFSNYPEATVKPEGLEAGAKAASEYLLKLLNREGAAAVMRQLSRIHADVPSDLFTRGEDKFGTFGFYCGVTNMAVRVRHAHEKAGLQRVEAVIRSFPSGAPANDAPNAGLVSYVNGSMNLPAYLKSLGYIEIPSP
jgi:hypothetical protein